MTRIRSTEVPAHSLLSSYSRSGAYVDCYATEISALATHAQFVEAFYTTPLFKLERLLLKLLISRPSTDTEAKQLAHGEVSSFAAWRVESRAPNEVLLSAGRTRSWLMVSSSAEHPASGTRLMFGSAVVPRRSAKSGSGSLGASFHALLGFHKLYSRALLHSAKSRLSRGSS
jgi:hypothetical protein